MGSEFKRYSFFSFYFVFNIVLVITLGLLLLLRLVFPAYFSEIVFKFMAVVGVIPVLIGTVQGIIKKEINTDLLAAVALVFAYLAGEWYSAAFINLMLSSARIFDLWTQKKSENLIKSLLKYRPDTVKVQVEGKVENKKIDEIKPGDILVIDKGARIPVDGVITSGKAEIDESTLTGESSPVIKGVGDVVLSPTLNISGPLIIRATKGVRESTLSKIISMVEEASIKKAKIVKTADKFAKWYILATLVGSVVIYALTRNINFVLSILLVVCADDIAVSIPLAFSVAVVRGSEKGIIIKSTESLEKVTHIEAIITDKTGTLTFAKPKIVKTIIFGKISKEKFFKYLGAAEAGSSHPIAKPIMDYVRRLGITIPSSTNANESSGEGVKVVVAGKQVVVGKVDLLKRYRIKITKDELGEIYESSREGLSNIVIAIDRKLVGLVLFEDQVRPSAKETIIETKRLGVKKWIMLTGDNPIITQKVALEVGVDEAIPSMTAEAKMKFIQKYKQSLTSRGPGKKNTDKNYLAMIGDGVNDAAALALSDVSFAMGVAGSDAAIEASDISIMDDDLAKIPMVMKLGQETQRIIGQIFGIWAVTNLAGLLLVFGGFISPTGAATFNFLTDFLPIFNALRVGTSKN